MKEKNGWGRRALRHLPAFAVLTVAIQSGCVDGGGRREAVVRELREVLLGYECRDDVMATILAQRGDALVTVRGSGHTQRVTALIRYVRGNAARCEIMTWFRREREPVTVAYDVPDAGPALRALYECVPHAPHKPEYVTYDASHDAHLTIGSEWKFCNVGVIGDYLTLGEDQDEEAEDRAALAKIVMSEPMVYSEQGATELLIMRFDMAGVIWQAGQSRGPGDRNAVE